MHFRAAKHKKLLRLTALFSVFALLCASLPFILNVWVLLRAKPFLLTPEEAAQKQADCVLVLGAKVMDSGKPSPMLADRLQYGVELYQAGAAPKLLVSGDHGQEQYNEVASMKNYAIDYGIADEDILMDHAGFSTYESMYRARDIFQVKRVIIVTQGYHLSRAVYIARSLGLEAYGVASDPRSYGKTLYNNSREFLARCKDTLQCVFQPEPTYLGEVIPVNGDGRATNDSAFEKIRAQQK